MQRLARGVGHAHLLLLLTLRLRHLGQCDDNKNEQHNQTYGHIGIADDCQVMNANVCLLCLTQGSEDNLAGSIAAVAPQMGQHDERCHAHTTQ